MYRCADIRSETPLLKQNNTRRVSIWSARFSPCHIYCNRGLGLVPLELHSQLKMYFFSFIAFIRNSG